MIPAINTSKTDVHTATPKNTTGAIPARPATAAPKILSTPGKATSPGMLSLNLKLMRQKNEEEATPNDTAPNSSSPREKKKVERSITEVRSHKRPIDDADGPGFASTQVQKRQKTATPPRSPRGDASPRKQMIKSPRAVADLNPMVTDALQRHRANSLPESPRSQSLGKHAGEALTLATSNRGATTKTTSRLSVLPQDTSAPQWQQTSSLDTGNSALSVSSSGHASSSDGKARRDTIAVAPPQTPVAAPASQTSSVAEPAEFTFTECRLETDGHLVGGMGLPSSASMSELRSSWAASIKQELSIATRSVNEAAAAHCAVLEQRAEGGGATKAARHNPVAVLRAAMLNLQTASILAELSCEVSQMQQIEKYLQELVSELATFRSALNGQDVADARSNVTPLEKEIRKALSNSLDAMEIACTYGLGVLADEKAYTIGNTSTAANSTQPSRVLPTDNKALLSDLNDLDALMDSEIVLGKATTSTTTASTVPPKQQ